MTTQTMPLEQRIAAAFKAGRTSIDLAALIKEVETAAEAATTAADQAHTVALDPELSAGELSQARQRMHDADFARDRLRAALPKLHQRLTHLQSEEEDARRRVNYDEVKCERDRLAAELKRIYPKFAASLSVLLAKIVANDQAIGRTNQALPNGYERLMGAELVGRGLTGFRQKEGNVPSITRELRMPAFVCPPTGKDSWPPPYIPKVWAAHTPMEEHPRKTGHPFARAAD